MKQFCVITFNKKGEENFLVDLVCFSLKNLYRRGYFLFLDDVLIDKGKRRFVFGGDVKYIKI